MHRKEFASQNIYVNYLRNLYIPPPPLPYKNLSTDTTYFTYNPLHFFRIVFEQFASYNEKNNNLI